MNQFAIRVEELSKRYVLGAAPGPSTFAETVVSSVASAPRKALRWIKNRGGSHASSRHDFYALKGVSFEVGHGEVVGVIGGNGAGKSTLLKILSRITHPSGGFAEIRGRVGSLLEVGTGFHPELTGRENIYLNGAILGMTNADIRARFDEIVAFAETEEFLDVPVKRYSSGMSMRLAFSVAAHLEPEILIVDEVLAVGDAAFQRKCVGRMGTVAKHGRTVLFVSHSMAAISALCERVLVFSKGKLVADTTDISRAISIYSGEAVGGQSWVREETGDDRRRPLVFKRLRCELKGEQPDHVLEVEMTLESLDNHRDGFLCFDITDSGLTPLMQAMPQQEPFIRYSRETQEFTVAIKLPPLIPGVYRIGAWVGPHYTETYDEVSPVLEFVIHTSPNPERSFPHATNHGFLVPPSAVYSESTADSCDPVAKSLV
jgi:lipopolysaccharide transport system ATP-binding protein